MKPVTYGRRIGFGGREHQQRETHALHTHHTSRQLAYYGDGRTVMAVAKNPRAPFVEVLGESGLTADGLPFVYADYFLPEEMGA